MSSVLFSILRTYFSNSSLFHPPAWGESRLLHRTPTEGLAEDWPRLSRNPENSSHRTWSHWAAVNLYSSPGGRRQGCKCHLLWLTFPNSRLSGIPEVRLMANHSRISEILFSYSLVYTHTHTHCILSYPLCHSHACLFPRPLLIPLQSIFFFFISQSLIRAGPGLCRISKCKSKLEIAPLQTDSPFPSNQLSKAPS